MVQLSHPYTTTGKTIALTRWNFIYVYRHICIQTYVRKSFEKEYNSILDKENKSTSIYIFFFSNVHFGHHVGSKTLSSNVVYVHADKIEICLNPVTLAVEQLIYNS